MLRRPQLYGAKLNIRAAIPTYCMVGSVRLLNPVLKMIERDIGCWHLADIQRALIDVRFRGYSGRRNLRP